MKGSASAKGRGWPAGTDVVRVRLGPRSYDVVVGGSMARLLSAAASILDLSGRAAGVLFDSNTERLFSSDTLSVLKRRGIRPHGFSIPAGERSKTPEKAGQFVDFMLTQGLDRTSFVVVVGGGVPGDLGAFAASIFMRGIPVLQVPTTLMAQVDASIGGKTGVDLPFSKNLIGTFWQPMAVLASLEALPTLSERDYAGGLAEVAKYAMIADAGLMRLCERSVEAVMERDPEALRRLIKRCARIKAQVVAQDEREAGLRAILNYGHTVGHALEAASRYRRLSHGEAVSIGMVVACEIAAQRGLADRDTCLRQHALLESYGLPTRVPAWAQTEHILALMGFDKKRRGRRLRLVLPTGVGKVTIADDVPPKAIRAAIAAARGTRKKA